MRWPGFSRPGLHTLAGPYALNALDPAERIAFERHLARCDACAQEVRGLRETAARLGEAASTGPPPGLRERVIAAARRTPQQGPPADARRSAAPVLAGWRRWAPQLAVVAALAALAGAAVAGVAAVGTRHSLDHAEAGNSEVAAVLTARDAHMMTAPVSGGGSATVVMSHSKRMLVFTTRGLPALAGAQSYELWLLSPAGQRPAGMLPRPRRGMTAPVVASGLARGDKVGLTVEPSAGSPRPTTSPILMLDLSA
jgi:anti-sigma-K factor RskA